MGEHKQGNGSEVRETFFQLNKRRLEELAHRAMYKKKMLPEDFVIVCINVDDLSWTDLAEELMPGCDWQSYRDRNEKPVARGSVLADGLCEYVSQVVPGIKDALFGELPDGCVRTIVMDGGGASVYLIQPVPEEQIAH